LNNISTAPVRAPPGTGSHHRPRAALLRACLEVPSPGAPPRPLTRGDRTPEWQPGLRPLPIFMATKPRRISKPGHPSRMSAKYLTNPPRLLRVGSLHFMATLVWRSVKRSLSTAFTSFSPAQAQPGGRPKTFTQTYIMYMFWARRRLGVSAQLRRTRSIGAQRESGSASSSGVFRSSFDSGFRVARRASLIGTQLGSKCLRGTRKLLRSLRKREKNGSRSRPNHSHAGCRCPHCFCLVKVHR
jgi:hypothetical protein